MADLHDKLLAALKAEPKPLTGVRVLEVAKTTLPGAQFQQFELWMRNAGPHLLEILNG